MDAGRHLPSDRGGDRRSLRGRAARRSSAAWADVVLRQLDHVAEALAREAREHPGAPAVIGEERTLSYGDLDSQANRIARELGARGLAEGGLVVVAQERSADLLPTLLGVWRAGGAYVPVDPGYPAERTRFIVEQADPAVIVSQTSVAAGLPTAMPTCC